MTDAEGEEKAVERRLALGIDCRDQIARGYFGPALADQQILFGDSENVGRGGNQAIGKEALDGGDPEPLDIEGVTRHKMAESLDLLRRADQPA